uniref:Uncharacterized protein n=1 Tax=Tetranychus urticae TaxID=32264 RepID=T1KIQ6_TETUR
MTIISNGVDCIFGSIIVWFNVIPIIIIYKRLVYKSM